MIDLPEGAEKTQRVRAMFDAIAPRYEFVNHLLTMGMDRRWRRRAVRDMRLPDGSTFLDVAAGTGDFLRAGKRQGLVGVGADLSLGMLDAAGGRHPLVQCDAAQLPFADG